MSKPSRTGNRLRRDEIVTAAILVTPRLTAANRSGSESRAMLGATRGHRLPSVLPLPFLPGNAPHRRARDLARADKDERIKELRRALAAVHAVKTFPLTTIHLPRRGLCRQEEPHPEQDSAPASASCGSAKTSSIGSGLKPASHV